MPDAPRKYYLITDQQLEAAKKHWPQVNDKTWTVTLHRSDEPLLLNKPAHKGLGFARITVPESATDGMFYRRDIDVLILISGETPLANHNVRTG
jgi:hypothetical protein